jgi:high-affinity iron transporter
VGSTFLITLREGLEMALVVAIILAYLKRLGREKDFRTVWVGTGAAIAISLLAGGLIFALLGELEGRGEEVLEGVIAFSAAGVLTWMVFWMARQARHIKGELHAKVDAAVAAGSAGALAGIAFIAILREGMETALLLVSTSVGTESSIGQLTGGLLGIAISIGLGYLVYIGSRKVNLRVFFRVTGILVLLFAAGLLAKGIHEFQEAGYLATLNEHVFDISSITVLNPDSSTIGEFLKGIFGWSPNPSIEMLVAYFLYLIPVGATFLGLTRNVPAVRTVKAAQAEAASPA